MPDGRIRLTVLGGYLGSGKTTWLRHHLRGLADPPHILVNEAAEVPIDDLLLSAACIRVLAGGCACCTGKAQFASVLRSICDQHPRPASILLETSGLADPAALVAVIRDDPVLVHHILVTEIVVLVDALNALAQLATDPLGRAQITSADRLVLTKLDAVPALDLAGLRLTLRTLNPSAPITGAASGVVVPLPPLPEGARAVPLPALTGLDARPVAAVRLSLPADLDWAAFSLWLSALLQARGDDLVRVKGVVNSPAGRLLLQSVRRVVQSPEVLPAGHAHERDGTLVLIGRGAEEASLRRSLDRFLAP